MALILVTNDDGVTARGITLLAEALSEVAEVLVVAPEREQSAVSRKITLREPLRFRQLSPDRFGVSGTPTDAVFLGVHRICPFPPDLIVSGINHGANLGSDLGYSGTVAAAIEGANKGVCSFAISQAVPRKGPGGQDAPSFDELLGHAARFGAALARQLLEDPLPHGVAFNVNLPNRLSDEYRFTEVGGRIYRGQIVERSDPRGQPYFWIGGPVIETGEPEGSDAQAIEDGVISLSAIRPRFDAPRPDSADSWSLRGFSPERRGG